MALTYDAIATTTLGAAASSINFTGIPSTYTDLKIVLYAPSCAQTGWTGLRVNSVSTGSYGFASVYSNGQTALNNLSSNNDTYIQVGYISTTTEPFQQQIDIFNYAQTGYKRGIICNANLDNNTTGGYLHFGANSYTPTTGAINEVNLLGPGLGNFSIGTVATVYGIKRA